MAPRVKPAQSQIEPPKIIAKEQFLKVIKKLKSEESVIAQSKGTMGSTVEKAVAEHNLHPDALRVFRKYSKKNPVQQAEFFLQLSTYWEYGKLGHPNQDLLETPAERKGKSSKPGRGELARMKETITDDRLTAGTHVIQNGKVVPISREAQAEAAE